VSYARVWPPRRASPPLEELLAPDPSAREKCWRVSQRRWTFIFQLLRAHRIVVMARHSLEQMTWRQLGQTDSSLSNVAAVCPSAEWERRRLILSVKDCCRLPGPCASVVASPGPLSGAVRAFAAVTVAACGVLRRLSVRPSRQMTAMHHMAMA